MPMENQFIKVTVSEKVVIRNRTMDDEEAPVYPSYFPQSLKETRYDKTVCELLRNYMADGADQLSSFSDIWTENMAEKALTDKDANDTRKGNQSRK